MNKLLFLSVILICTVISNAQNSVATEMESDLAKLNRELDNPLAKRSSVAGDNDRKEVILTDFQYVLRRNFGAQSIGMGPSVKIDWTKPFSNGFTFPIGLGYTKTIKIGNTPYKIRFEPQYSLIRPDNYGNAWNIRFQIAPVIRSPFIST